MTRVHSVSDVFASGYMWAPKTEWADDLIEECHSFPSGKFDDQLEHEDSITNERKAVEQVMDGLNCDSTAFAPATTRTDCRA